VRHDTKHAGVQSKFKEWRQAKNLTDYLPDEYQYPGDEADECAPSPTRCSPACAVAEL
jgi:hypothetical protein